MAELLTILDRIDLQFLRLLSASERMPAWLAEEVTAGRCGSADSVAAIAALARTVQVLEGASVTAGEGPYAVEDFADDGGRDAAMFCPRLIWDEERADEGSEGGGGVADWVSELAVVLPWLPVYGGDGVTREPTVRTHRRWLRRLVSAMVVDDQLVEAGTGEPLLVDVVEVGSALDVPGEQAEGLATVLVVEVHYSTLRGSRTEGPGFTERMV